MPINSDTFLVNSIIDLLEDHGFKGLDGPAIVFEMQSRHWTAEETRKAYIELCNEGIVTYVPSGRYKLTKFIPR
jgi:hypothetical protein